MISLNKIRFTLLILAVSLSSLQGQIVITMTSEEKNLGEKLEIAILSPAIREALLDEGFSIISQVNEKAFNLDMKVSTRKGSESMGIFTSFADILITLKSPDGVIVREKSFTGMKGAGLGFDHAGIDAIKKSSAEVIPAIIQMLKDNVKYVSGDVVPNNYHLPGETRKDVTPPEIKASAPVLSRNNDVATVPEEVSGKYYALIIGINEYQDPGIMSLDNPVSDAENLFKTITTLYTFSPESINFLKNPTRAEIIIAFDEISKKITRDDNLLIFYAGHGLWDNRKRLGYWLPADAGRTNTAFWIYNSTIQDIIKSIPSKHTLLIADACFSGSIFKTRKAFDDAPQSIEKLYELPSRKAMTSGMMTEVPDKSVFLEYLNKRLQENKETYLSSERLFTSFREAVLNNSPNTPQYGIIQDTGDEGGDFIFIRKSY